MYEEENCHNHPLCQITAILIFTRKDLLRCDHRVPQRLGELGRAGNHGIKDPKGACGSGLFVIFGLGL